MLVGDLSSENKASIEGHVAVYACPKAYSGNYQLLLRRVFGKLTTGQVSVELITHYGTSKATTLEKKIPLNNSEALVKFDVADGRRKDSIEEQQVFNAALAAVAQVNLSRHPEILAQQVAAVNDPQAAAALGAAQQSSAAAAAGQTQQINPLAFPSAGWGNGLHSEVGYQPVIVTLPTGTNMKATGVVSADRRYVRVTCEPVFSAISNVQTFSFAGGAGGAAGGVGGGGGIGNNNGGGGIGNNNGGGAIGNNNGGGGIGNNNGGGGLGGGVF